MSAETNQAASKARRMRTTVVVEYETQEDLEEGLRHGLQLARDRYMGVKISLKDRDEHGPTIEVRTTRCRRDYREKRRA